MFITGTRIGDERSPRGAGALLPVTDLPDLDALARYGLSIDDVQQAVAVAQGGAIAGQVFEGDRRFDIVVRSAQTNVITASQRADNNAACVGRPGERQIAVHRNTL